MEKLTNEFKKKAYEYALDKIHSHHIKTGICIHLQRFLHDNGIKKSVLLFNDELEFLFPELWKHKPIHIHTTLMYWFGLPEVESNKSLREQVLKDCIKQCSND